MQSFDTCVKVPKYIISCTSPPPTSPSHLKPIWKPYLLECSWPCNRHVGDGIPIWKPYLLECSWPCNRHVGDGIPSASYIFGGTYLSKFKWVFDWWHLFMRAKTGLHALRRSLQHLAKEVQRAFAMFEAPQVDVKLFHYKVLWTLMCIRCYTFATKLC